MEVCSSTGMGAPGASHLGTGDHGPKTDRSRPRSVPVNAQVLAKPLHFADLELEFVDCWERLGKELKVSRHQVNRTESTGHMFLVRAHNPKVVSSNLTPATKGAQCSSLSAFDFSTKSLSAPARFRLHLLTIC
jgi:hypothetical protein